MKKSNLTSIFKNDGFTLLEILIAITLLAFITIAIVSTTDNAFQTKERTTEVNKNNLQIETAMSRFEWDFSQIYSPLYFSTAYKMNQATTFGNTGSNFSQPSNTNSNANLEQYYQFLTQRFERNEHFISISQEGLPIPRFWAPEKNIFEFFTTSNRRKMQNTKQSHFAWVRYTLADPDPNEPKDEEENANIPKSLKNFVRYYTADDPYDDKRINIDDGKIKAVVLLKNVESLEFQYWDFSRKKWENSLKTIVQGEHLIRGVKIILNWYDSLGVKRVTERIFRPHWPIVTPEDLSIQNTQPGTANNNPTNGQSNTNPGTNNVR